MRWRTLFVMHSSTFGLSCMLKNTEYNFANFTEYIFALCRRLLAIKVFVFQLSSKTSERVEENLLKPLALSRLLRSINVSFLFLFFCFFEIQILRPPVDLYRTKP